MPAVLPQASSFWRGEPDTSIAAKTPTPFAGRIGANQEFALSRRQCADPGLLSKYPDAAPWVPLRDSLSPRQFFEIGLWKAAAVEGLGVSMLNGAICSQTYSLTKSDVFVTRNLLAGILDYPLPRGTGGEHEVSLWPFLFYCYFFFLYSCVNIMTI